MVGKLVKASGQTEEELSVVDERQPFMLAAIHDTSTSKQLVTLNALTLEFSEVVVMPCGPRGCYGCPKYSRLR